MDNFHELNAPLCNELIELMRGYLPITHVLLNGDVGALYYIIRESGVRNTYLNQLMDGLEKRKNNGTAYPLSITHSNMDALYKAVSEYLNKCFELTSTLQGLGGGELMAKDIEREISAHEIDCKIDQLKERFSQFFDEDEVENLIQLSMNLGKLFAKRDLDKKIDGCVLVPVEPTPKMIDSTWDYQDEINNMSHNSRNAFIYKNMIRVAIEEAARGGNE